jgi:hypothetical protein
MKRETDHLVPAAITVTTRGFPYQRAENVAVYAIWLFSVVMARKTNESGRVLAAPDPTQIYDPGPNAGTS